MGEISTKIILSDGVDDTVFDLSTPISLKSVEIDSVLPHVSLFNVNTPTDINIDNVSVKGNIDASTDNIEKLTITDSLFTTHDPLDFYNISNMTVNGLTIDGQISVLDSSDYICTISKSNVSEFVVSASITTRPETDSDNNIIAIEDSVVHNLDVDAYENRLYEVTQSDNTVMFESVERNDPAPNVYVSVWGGMYSRRTYAITDTGELWATGIGGEFGDGAEHDQTIYEFDQIGTDTDWDELSCGYHHQIALRNTDELWVSGVNTNGCLGLGEVTGNVQWTQIPGSWKKIACGYGHSFAINSDNELWGTGFNNKGQLGLPATITDFVILEWTLIPTGGYDVLEVSAGWIHSMIIVDNGTSNEIMSTGMGWYGALGKESDDPVYAFGSIPNGVGNWVSIATTRENSFAVKNDKLWACGTGEYTGTGLTGRVNEFTQTAITWSTFYDLAGGGDFMSCLTDEHTPGYEFVSKFFVGYDDHGESAQHLTVPTYVNGVVNTWVASNYVQIACGLHHVVTLRDDGTLWGSGNNEHGEIGAGDADKETLSRRVGIKPLPPSYS